MDRGGKRCRLKTPAASRDVVLMTGLGRELERLRRDSDFSGDLDLVFCAYTGRTMGHRNLAARGLEPAVKPAGLQRVTFHVLRYTFASILIAEGHDPVFVSRQLGHSTPAITLQVYAHLFDAARHAQQARDRLDARYGNFLGQGAPAERETTPAPLDDAVHEAAGKPTDKVDDEDGVSDPGHQLSLGLDDTAE